MGNLVITYCGCVQYLQSTLIVKDGEKTPLINPFPIWIRFDGVERSITQVFPTLEDLYEYLNSTFVNLYGLNGVFEIIDQNMEYSNPEDFQNAEIMIQFGLKNAVCTVGTSVPGPNVTVTAAFSNGSSFSSQEFFDMDIVQLKISGIPLQPVNGPTGFTYISDDPDNPGMGTITTGSPLEDCIMEVIFTQIPQ